MSGPNIPGLQQPYDIPLQYFGLPTSIPANGNAANPAFYNNGFTDLSLALTSTQSGTISTQRYLDAAGTIPQGSAFTGTITANTPYTQNIESDGTPWQSFITTVTNSSGSIATLSNVKAVLFNSYAASNSTINVGKVSIDQTTPGTTNGVVVNNTGANPVPVTVVSGTTGGTSTFSAQGGTSLALLTATAVTVKAFAGNLFGIDFVNTGASVAYVQIFDLLIGSVTLGTTVPKMAKWVPAGGAWEEKFCAGGEIKFTTGIAVAATTTATGLTAPATGINANITYA